MLARLKSNRLFSVSFGCVFLLSGFFLNAIQLMLHFTLRFISLRHHRILIAFLVRLHWCQLLWVVEWWSGLKMRYFGTPEDFAHLGNENAICLCNHRSDLDWLLGWLTAEKHGCLGGAKALMKKSARYVPVMGWTWWFAEYIFLARNWATDQNHLEESYARYRSFPLVYWMVIYAEGTRLTPEKLEASQAFSKERGFPVLKHHLQPRTKGFTLARRFLKDDVPAIYDVCLAFPEGKEPSLQSILEGKPGEAHMLIRRIPTDELPLEEDALDEWCRQLYVDKDKAMETFATHGRFDENEIDRPKTTAARRIMNVWLSLFTGLLTVGMTYTIAMGNWWILAVVVGFGAFTALLLKIWRWNSVAGSKAAPMLGNRKPAA